MKPGPGETLDSIIFPDLLVLQKKRGYRFGLDPLLLLGSLETCPGGPAIELGCGCGVLAMLLARRWPRLRVTGLEIQPSLASMARRSVALNGLQDRVAIRLGDVRSCAAEFPAGAFGLVCANPPYRKAGTGRLPPDPERAAARHELLMNLADVVGAIDHLMAPAGLFALTWKPERLPELEETLRLRGLALRQVRLVSSREADPPFLALCRGGRAEAVPPVETPPPVTVYRGRAYTPELEHLLHTGEFPRERLEKY